MLWTIWQNFWAQIEFPAGPEWVDILTVAGVGVAIHLALRWQFDLIKSKEDVARNLRNGCYAYAITQFLTNHAEAQGVLLAVIWVFLGIAWEKGYYSWVVALAAVKLTIFISTFLVA